MIAFETRGIRTRLVGALLIQGQDREVRDILLTFWGFVCVFALCGGPRRTRDLQEAACDGGSTIKRRTTRLIMSLGFTCCFKGTCLHYISNSHDAFFHLSCLYHCNSTPVSPTLFFRHIAEMSAVEALMSLWLCLLPVCLERLAATGSTVASTWQTS